MSYFSTGLLYLLVVDQIIMAERDLQDEVERILRRLTLEDLKAVATHLAIADMDAAENTRVVLRIGWGVVRFFRLGRESASLKLENLLVDHEEIHFFVMDLILALLLDF